jgi:cysteinyl-tRNA synthetase
VANAMTVLDRELKEINTLSMKKDADLEREADLVKTFTYISDILGLRFVFDPLTDEDRVNLEAYEEARVNKDYAKSDELRKVLSAKGIL